MTTKNYEPSAQCLLDTCAFPEAPRTYCNDCQYDQDQQSFLEQEYQSEPTQTITKEEITMTTQSKPQNTKSLVGTAYKYTSKQNTPCFSLYIENTELHAYQDKYDNYGTLYLVQYKNTKVGTLRIYPKNIKLSLQAHNDQPTEYVGFPFTDNAPYYKVYKSIK